MAGNRSTPPGSGIEVECYAGYRGEETPRLLKLDGREIEVVAVLERWREPHRREFRVRGDDGRIYRLLQETGSGRWELEPVERGGEPCTESHRSGDGR